MSQEQTTSTTDPSSSRPEETNRFRRTLDKIEDIFYHPFSASALSSLPSTSNEGGAGGSSGKSKRADRIPDVSASGKNRPLIRDYQTIPNADNIQVRIPKKLATPIKVEQKVWLANERTFISYLSITILMSTLSLGLWNASAKGSLGRWFGGIYAAISILVLVYAYAMFQKRLTMIGTRDAGQFDQLVGPLVICLALFIALLVNFILRYQDLKHTVEGNLW
ncbi:hypothetical protein HD553DRAFT_324536 [Filobasidium floriforme]|uniref:uncharacterized protein n=1 Tax=Filobasidium floriforme TaxID=5210 RepID=UPI001E8D5789|nr:uncharacterized protein HD553DRAFT_324536 [Filobasidium floriforme]KAH8083653.1 hypothetical protein HD553DRAFT_324536 [Filobasidium floriforme]